MEPLRFECQYICVFFMDRDVEPHFHTIDLCQERNGVRGEGTSAKEANEGREWLYVVAMTVNGGVAVSL